MRRRRQQDPFPVVSCTWRQEQRPHLDDFLFRAFVCLLVCFSTLRKETCLSFKCPLFLSTACPVSPPRKWPITVELLVHSNRVHCLSAPHAGGGEVVCKGRSCRAAEVGLSGKSRSADVDVDPNWAEKSHEIRLSWTSCFLPKQYVRHKRTFSILKLPFLITEPGSKGLLVNITTNSSMVLLEAKWSPVSRKLQDLPQQRAVSEGKGPWC